MILLWQMRQEAEYYLSRTIVQSAVDPDGGKATTDAWKEYTDRFYPYLKAETKKSDEAALGYLVKEVKKGSLSVRPLMPIVKSRLRGKKRGESNVTELARNPANPGVPRMRVRKSPRKRGVR